MRTLLSVSVSRAALLTLGLAGVLALASCQKSESPPEAPVPVVLATAAEKTVPVTLRTFGSVEAHQTVSIKAQVGGELIKVHFAEGQDVKKGDLLFNIDPRQLEVNLRAAEANRDRDTAQMHNAENDFKRAEELLKNNSATPREYDQIRFALEAIKAAVRADEAMVDNARLQISYATITSPLDGHTGPILIDEHNLVKVNDLPLVCINQIDPIDVTFSVPQREMPAIRKYMAVDPLAVEATVPPVDGHPAKTVRGTLSFTNNEVDQTTGMFKLKATFENKSRILWPGQFVNVVLYLSAGDKAVAVPSEAVQSDQRGQVVYVVVGKEQKIEIRPVKIGRSVGDWVAIEKDADPGKCVAAGERVVTDGHLLLVPGSKIKEKPAVAAAPAESAATQAEGGAGAGVEAGTTGSERPTVRGAGL